MGYSPSMIAQGMKTTVAFWKPQNATLLIAYKAMMAGRSLRGGGSRGGAVLFDGAGYAGIQSEMMKLAIQSVSISVALLKKEMRVDLKIGVGQMAPVYTSLLAWGLLSERFKFLVDITDYRKVPKTLIPYVTVAHREDAIFLWVSTVSPPTLKVTAPDLQNSDLVATADEVFLRAHIVIAKRYVYVGPVYSEQQWRNSYVYKHPVPPIEFCAIVSSEENLGIACSGEIDPGETGECEEGIRIRPLLKISYSEHMSAVVRANLDSVTWFLCPKERYNSWVNMIRGPPRNMMVTLEQGEWNVVEWNEYHEPKTVMDKHAPIEEETDGTQALEVGNYVEPENPVLNMEEEQDNGDALVQ